VDLIWQRAKNTPAEGPARGDELQLLGELRRLFAAAMSET
jgi:hypothetical protein